MNRKSPSTYKKYNNNVNNNKKIMNRSPNYSNPFAIPKPIIMERLRPFLDQDIGFGDLSSGVIAPDATAKAHITSKSEGIIAGAEELK